jgi:uncharacterized membrane protein
MRRQIKLEHVISFGDAIFAFSITFMAISIQIPNLPENLTQEQVINILLEQRSHFEIYVISFLVIGVYWISYHQIFNHITATHGIMIWLNLAFLFSITLISFAVDLQVQYGFFYIIFAIYALVLTLSGSLLTLIWLHAKKKGLIDNTLKSTEIKNITLQSVLTPSVFAFSILISIVNVQIAYYFWLVIIPAKIIIHRQYPY